jgi:plasmid stabilization system protein ParE
MKIQIKWNRKAIQQLDDAIEYIELDSSVNAEKIKRTILLTIDGLLKHPEKYNPDKYKIDNDGSYRAFELYHFRISYRYRLNEIRIIRMRHTKLNPLKY